MEALIAVAVRSTACVCGRSLFGTAGWNPTGSMSDCLSVCCECCVLSGRSLCVRLITRPEESYRLWCVWGWSWSLDKEEAVAQWGAVEQWEKKNCMEALKRTTKQSKPMPWRRRLVSLILEAWVWSVVSLCRICGGRRSNRTGFSVAIHTETSTKH